MVCGVFSVTLVVDATRAYRTEDASALVLIVLHIFVWLSVVESVWVHIASVSGLVS